MRKQRQETPSNATKFNSWSLLCRGTGRTLPNTNDIFHSRNYAVKPRGLAVSNGYNRRCKICKFLEDPGTPKKDLYKDHLGNLPFNCPQWSNMEITKRGKAAMITRYCPQCLNSRSLTTKNTKKHKFTCLNEECATHS